MMDQVTQPQDVPQDLPQDLVQRLHHLAAAQTAESRPWPGVTNAVRRSKRRRMAGVSAVAISCAAVIGVTFSGALGLTSNQSAPPAQKQSTTTPTPPAGPLPESGFAGPIGGSLAGNQAWVKQVRTRVAELATEARKDDRGGQKPPTWTAADIQLLWTSDLGGSRYAFAVYKDPFEPNGLTFYTSAALRGPAGASANQLTFMRNSGTSGTQSGTADATYEITKPGSRFPDLVLITTPPEITQVEVASGRKFHLDGTSTTTWRPLHREGGALWVSQLTPGEGFLSQVRSVGGDITATTNQHFPSHSADAVKVAPAGSNLAAVRSAGGALNRLEPSLEEQPVLSTSRRLTNTAQLAATVFRSPDGVALVGFAERDLKFKATSSRREQWVAAIGNHPLGHPDTFMIALSTPKNSSASYVVLAPVGATSARIGKVTVPVRNRLARFERSSSQTGQVTVEALDAQGKVMASFVSIKGK